MFLHRAARAVRLRAARTIDPPPHGGIRSTVDRSRRLFLIYMRSHALPARRLGRRLFRRLRGRWLRRGLLRVEELTELSDVGRVSPIGRKVFELRRVRLLVVQLRARRRAARVGPFGVAEPVGADGPAFALLAATDLR